MAQLRHSNRKGLARRLANRDKSSLLGLSARGLSIANGFLSGVILVRVAPQSEVGEFFLISALAALLVAVFSKGLMLAMARQLAQHSAAQRSIVLGTLKSLALPWVLALTLVGALTFVAGATGVAATGALEALAMSVLLSGALLLERALTEAGRGMDVFKVGILGDGIASRLVQTGVLLVLLVLGVTVSAPQLAVLAALSALLFCAPTWKLLRQHFGNDKSAETDIARPPTNLQLWAHAVTSAVIGQGDLLLVGIFLGASEAAIYGVAWRLSTLTAAPNLALGSYVTAAIYRSRNGESFEQLRRDLGPKLAGMFRLSLVIGLGMAVVGWYAIPLVFGPEYGEAYMPANVLNVGQLVVAWVGPAGFLLIALHREGRLLIATASGALVLMALVPLGGVLMGVTGAAFGMALSLLAASALRNWLAAAALQRSGWRRVWAP